MGAVHMRRVDHQFRQFKYGFTEKYYLYPKKANIICQFCHSIAFLTKEKLDKVDLILGTNGEVSYKFISESQILPRFVVGDFVKQRIFTIFEKLYPEVARKLHPNFKS
ncbi:hypothetical protein RF11_16006 [Thelohanellus kitauei]|uniref:Uncharacterized protein n=1 Tax=Thelohanellus kitauei TaxID=669202 RepID=A0A0C2MY46_THEKT|nr:hypothetical protein RF11_16006 [Thelohanellus kitauei]